jgi:hypothetical protein
MDTSLSFLKNGIIEYARYYPVRYSARTYTEKRKVTAGTMTIYARTYDHLPAELKPRNEMDCETDCFTRRTTS